MEHTIQNSQNCTCVPQAMKDTQKVREEAEFRTFSEVLAKGLQVADVREVLRAEMLSEGTL